MFRIRQTLKGSLWVLPLVGGLLGARPQQRERLARGPVLRSAWLGLLDGHGGDGAHDRRRRSVGLTGFVVTVTVLVVQMATGTFSPRYMRLWYRDSVLKATLAVLVGSACLLVHAAAAHRRERARPRSHAGRVLPRRRPRALPRLPRPLPPPPAARQGGIARCPRRQGRAAPDGRAREHAPPLRRRRRARRASRAHADARRPKPEVGSAPGDRRRGLARLGHRTTTP